MLTSEELQKQTEHDESIRQIQQQAYSSGWHAAMSEIIRILMRMQAANIKTPFDASQPPNPERDE